jgi:SAM-dependent methyltransferase
MSHIGRFARLASAIGNPIRSESATILDFGCGNGAAVVEERANGLNVLGCDMSSSLDTAPKDLIERGVLRAIDVSNYRIPFENDEFDMVVSNQVLEHVQNYEEAFREIRRVLKPGGISIHIFPSRYTPVEPHIYVPLATFIRSMNWLKLWAYIGIRNEYQKDLPSRRVAELNEQYLRRCTKYLTKSELRHQITKSFSTILFVEKEYLAAGKRYGPTIAKLPFVPLLFGEFVERVIALR